MTLPTPVVWILALISVGSVIYQANTKSLTKDQLTNLKILNGIIFVVVMVDFSVRQQRII